MIPPVFDYVRPSDLGEALRILKEREGEAKVLSGGYSLLPLLKLRLAQPALLIDLQAIGGLDGISRTDDDIRIRNWGTIGGSVAHADPSADWPAVLQAVRASIVLRSADGERVVPARGFFVDIFQTGIEPAEILTEVRIPLPGPKTGSAYQKLERRAGDFSTVGAATLLTLGDDGRIAQVGIGLTAVADAPFAATNAEDALRGGQPGDELFREAAAAASRQSRPP